MVRSHFLDVLHQGLMQLKLPLEYMAMFLHAADVPGDVAFRQRAKQCFVANVKRRRAFLARHISFNENPSTPLKSNRYFTSYPDINHM